MVFEYFPDTDSFYIALRPSLGADAKEVAPDVILDYDAKDAVIGFTIEHASERVELSSLSVTRIPPLAA